MTKILTITLAGSLAVLAAGCSSNEPNANTTTTTTNTTNTASTLPPKSETATSGAATSGDVPANVRAVFPDAQSLTAQHKDLSAATISSIEKASGNKVADKDHHAYLAFSTSGGARRQIGAATVIKAEGQEMVVVYDSKEGSPVIREVRGGNLPSSFLDQFKGKGHDNPLAFGNDIKASGAPETTARAVTSAIKADVLAMQSLYGSSHSH
ncbi:MAG: hypothetical protein M3R15_32480 [Acidobacteriota bacterium]|nr:hypothetical protein [Acidobacteriota bacterium]